jgi:hypothetical protein
MRSLLRNLLRRWSLPVNYKKICAWTAPTLIVATLTEKFFSEAVQSGAIHAMVAGNER